MGSTSVLHREIKAKFFPAIEAKGFRIDTSDQPQSSRFRRDLTESVHLFDIQWDKTGKPRFVVNFGEVPNRPLQFYDQTIQPQDLRVYHSPSYLRLQRRRGGSMGCWYQTHRPLISWLLHLGKPYTPEEVIAQLLTHFSEVEDWWSTKIRGAGIRLACADASPPRGRGLAGLHRGRAPRRSGPGSGRQLR